MVMVENDRIYVNERTRWTFRTKSVTEIIELSRRELNIQQKNVVVEV